MKKLLSIGFAIALTLGFVSCEKWDNKKETKGEYYYSTDYKEAEGSILNLDIVEITKLYSVFFYEGKQLRYKLVIHDSSEESNSNCGFGDCGDKDSYAAYEEGRADVDDQLNITFIPDNNPSGSYAGYFENDKKNYKVTLPNVELREINFVLK